MRHVLNTGVGTNGRVGGELDRADVGNISRGGNQLEGGLLLRVSDVDGDFAGTHVRQGRLRSVGVFYPLDGLRLTGLPRGGSSRGRGLHSFKISELASGGEKARKSSRKWWRKPRARRRRRPTRE